MKIKYIYLILTGSAVCAAVWMLSPKGDGNMQPETQEVPVAKDSAANLKKEMRERVRARRRAREGSGSEDTVERVKPVFNLDDDEFAELDELQRAVLEELQAAVDAGNIDGIRSVLERMKARGLALARANGSDDWAKYVPLAMRRAAVAALGWSGSGSIAELVEYLADPDAEVVADAQSQLELALQDFEMGDYDLAEVVVNLMKITTDSESLDSYFMELSRMRNSVMISTLVEIADSGTAAAQEKIPENISFYTGDDSITTVEQAEKWLEENPDGADDDEFYGNKQPASDDEYHDVQVPGWKPPMQ